MTKDSSLSRRRWLQLATAGSAGVLAGCSQGGETTTTSTTTEGGGGGDDGDGDTTETTTQGRLKQTLRVGTSSHQDLTNIELAPWTTGPDFGGVWQFFAWGGWVDLSTNDYIYLDWAGEPELDEGAAEYRFTIRDDVQWHVMGDGVIDEVTAEDLVLSHEVGRLLVPESERNPHPAEVGWHADGEKTFVVELNEEYGYNDAQLLSGYIGETIETYREGPFKEKLQALKDASSKDEKDKVRTEVTQLSQHFDSKPLSGPWMVDELAQQRLRLELNTDHYVADQVNFDGWEIRTVAQEGNAGYAACRQDQLDVCGVPNTVTGPPDFIKTVVPTTGAGFGQGFIVPYSSPADPVFWKEPVVAAKTRQAIAFGVDKRQAGRNQFSVPDAANRPNPARFLERQHLLHTDAQAKDVLGDDYQNFPTYEQDKQKAASLFREAGFTKDGGTWYKPDGDPFKLEILQISWTQKAVQTMVSQLSDMGLKVSGVQTSRDTFVSKYWGQHNEFPSIIAESGPHQGPPSSFMEYWWDPAGSTVHPPGSEDRDAEWTKYPVPPVGDMEGEPTEEVDVRALAAELDRKKEADLRDQVRKLAWVNAYHLPCYEMMQFPESFGLNTNHFGFPEPHPEFSEDQYGGNYAIATGEHNAVYFRGHNQIPIQRLGGGEGFGGTRPIHATNEE